MHGARCQQELTQDECRVYEENYAGQGGASAAFIVVNNADMPGPGCSISNQAVVFYYNTAATNVQCGVGTASSMSIICVCVDKVRAIMKQSSNRPKPSRTAFCGS